MGEPIKQILIEELKKEVEELEIDLEATFQEMCKRGQENRKMRVLLIKVCSLPANGNKQLSELQDDIDMFLTKREHNEIKT